MDLIPKPDQVVSAAGNVAHKVFYGGLADLRPMPRTLIDEGTLREVYHYRPAAKVKEQGDPVLLVTPLAAPALCFDLRRGCSLVEHLVTPGARRTSWSTARSPSGTATSAWSTGSTRWSRPRSGRSPPTPAADRCTWSAGAWAGSSRLLTAADSPDLPIASVTARRLARST